MLAEIINTVTILIKPLALSRLIESISPEDLIMNPNAPPAPVINRISKDFFKESNIHLGVSIKFVFFIKNDEMTIPINNATSGFPINIIQVRTKLSDISKIGYFINVDNEINNIGITIGKNMINDLL
jgi:hypothetical protein